MWSTRMAMAFVDCFCFSCMIETYSITSFCDSYDVLNLNDSELLESRERIFTVCYLWLIIEKLSRVLKIPEKF